MDKYLTIFTGQLDRVFDPETLFPDKKVYTSGWLNQKFSRKKTCNPKNQKKITWNKSESGE
jgi:hypothetical protein